MDPRLNHLLAQHRVANLHSAPEDAQLVTDAGTRRRASRDSSPIVRALPMPTAHPPSDAWPAASLPADMNPQPALTLAWPIRCPTSTEHKLSAAARMKLSALVGVPAFGVNQQSQSSACLRRSSGRYPRRS